MSEFKKVLQALRKTQNGDFDNQFEQEKIKQFKNLCKTKKLIFFGLGYYGKKMEKYLKLKYGVDVYGYYDWIEEAKTGKGIFSTWNDLAYIDLDKYYKGKDKLNIISYEEFYENPDDIIIFINMPIFLFSIDALNTAGNFQYFYTIRCLAKELINVEQLKKLEFASTFDLAENFNHIYSQAEIAKIITLYNILDDQKSKKVLLGVLKFRLTEDYNYYTEIKDELSLQYFDQRIIPINDKEVFIDCGGFIGDTIEIFNKITNGKFQHIYTYEPNKHDFKTLNENGSRLE